MKIYLIDFFHSSSSHLSRTHCANIAGGGYEDRFFTPVHTQHYTQGDCPYRCTHTDDILRLLNNTTYNQKHAPPKAMTTSGTSTSFFFPTQSKNVNPPCVNRFNTGSTSLKNSFSKSLSHFTSFRCPFTVLVHWSTLVM
uniref:(northern house mosquito) hypothetical protein n=1 Tax=Culex pipiens TaxID=7175 RepID=A0A8D8FVC0_CULPI